MCSDSSSSRAAPATVAADGDATTSGTAADGAVASPTISGNRLLVIDDEVGLLKTIATIGRGCDYAVEGVANAKDFFDRLANWLPTHIVLDLQMPVVEDRKSVV